MSPQRNKDVTQYEIHIELRLYCDNVTNMLMLLKRFQSIEITLIYNATKCVLYKFHCNKLESTYIALYCLAIYILSVYFLLDNIFIFYLVW